MFSLCAFFAFAENQFEIFMLEQGSWDKNLFNRVEVRLIGPFGLSLRTQLLDKRPVPPWGNWSEGIIEPGFGLYHTSTGSRVLYGKLETYGLAWRTRNIGSRTLPWYNLHGASGADLKNNVSASKEASIFCNFGTNEFVFGDFLGFERDFFGVSGRFSALFDKEYALFINSAGNFRINKNHKIRLEGLYTEKKLSEHLQNAWFSENPVLPGRDMRFFALNLLYERHFVGFTVDFARSQMFMRGEDVYLNAALRIGNRPWRASLAADVSGPAFIGSDGTTVGAGMRAGGRFEWFGKGTTKLFLESKLNADGIESPFDGSFSRVAFYFPAFHGFLISPTRIVLDTERESVSKMLLKDDFSATIGFRIGPARAALKYSISGFHEAKPDDLVIPYPVPCARNFGEAVSSAEFSYPFSFVTLKCSTAFRIREGKESVWNKTVSVTARLKRGRLSVRFSDNNDGGINWAVSWRLAMNKPF